MFRDMLNVGCSFKLHNAIIAFLRLLRSLFEVQINKNGHQIYTSKCRQLPMIIEFINTNMKSERTPAKNGV